MPNSDAYSIIRALMEKSLLEIQHREFIEWLHRLRSREQISEREIEELLQLADERNIYDLSTSEQLMAALN